MMPNGEMREVVREVNDDETEAMVKAAEKSKAIRRRVGTPLPTKGIGKKAGRGNWRL